MAGRVPFYVVLVSAIVVAGACSSSAPSSAPPTAGVALPQGTYTATIPSGVNAAPGKWKLAVTASGLMYTHPEGHSFSPGLVEEITATEIVLAPDPGCPVQEGTPTSGRYHWSVEGTSLTFEVISDSCQDRIDTLTSSEWSLSQ